MASTSRWTSPRHSSCDNDSANPKLRLGCRPFADACRCPSAAPVPLFLEISTTQIEASASHVRGNRLPSPCDSTSWRSRCRPVSDHGARIETYRHATFEHSTRSCPVSNHGAVAGWVNSDFHRSMCGFLNCAVWMSRSVNSLVMFWKT